jgi:hypothetical protein
MNIRLSGNVFICSSPTDIMVNTIPLSNAHINAYLNLLIEDYGVDESFKIMCQFFRDVYQKEGKILEVYLGEIGEITTCHSDV